VSGPLSQLDRAQEWADNCAWEHGLTKDCDGNTPIGQNMYIVSGGSGGFPNLNVSRAIEKWYDEVSFYHLDTLSCDAGEMCGHYTQVVWSKTQKVGCGIAYCDAVSLLDNPARFTNAVLLVCDYTPAGNYKNQSPYTKGVSCSAFEELMGGTSGWRCEEDLCQPCLPKDYQDASCACGLDETKCQNGGLFNSSMCQCDCQSDSFGAYCENSCDCEDIQAYKSGCPQWQTQGYCNEDSAYHKFMMTNCPKTCGFCDQILPESCNVA